MALSVLANRARVTMLSAPGTGPLPLGAAVQGYQSFVAAGILNGQLVSYGLEDGLFWEIGQGTFTTSPRTLTRNTIIASSNSNLAIPATILAQCYVTALASDLLLQGLSGTLPNYANDTAAAAGGIVIGQLYRNGSIVMIRVT
jgi:hypothetical protein